ncbi:uncharacterized protein [Magallana gigas]|uniref:uncharacterized protein isoform X1 n=1 Tax=Magallana gigas TaxID=29159 RepID=UPI00333EA1A3
MKIMLLTLIFTLVSFQVISAAGLISSIATGGCSVLIQWNSRTYSEYFISIRDKKDTNYFNIETNSNVFTFGEARPGQEYKIIWYPIKNRKRIENLTEEITVLVPSECLLESSTTHLASKETGNQSTVIATDVAETSPEVSFTLDMTTEFDKLGHNGFCTIYFWVSLIAFPIVIGVVMVLMYFCVARKKQDTKHRHQEEDQITRSARVDVKSNNYSNDHSYYYDEVEYSLAHESGI